MIHNGSLETLAETPRVLALMGSYHRTGTVDSVVSNVLAGAREAGAETRKIELVDQYIEFCRNCRTCCQEPGEDRGLCVIDDDVHGILSAVEEADALVLGAPVNFGDVNALTRAFMERTLGLTHWSWDMKAPRLRREGPRRPAVLVTSSAAPGLMTRLFARPLRSLRQLARVLGARPCGEVLVGFAGQRDFQASERAQRKARRLGRELVRRVTRRQPKVPVAPSACAGNH